MTNENGLFKDSDGFLVDSTYDGGDTANREGQWHYITDEDRGFFLWEIAQGYSSEWVRHPHQNSATRNPRNFTRDQATPMVAALGKYYYTNPKKFIHGQIMIKAFFYACLCRFGFMPNFDRDVPGSTKYPWPHYYPNEFDPNKKDFRYFDFADPMGFPFFGECVIAGRIWGLYWMLPWCYLMTLLAVYLHANTYAAKEENDDSWQIAIICDVYDRFFGNNFLLKSLVKWHKTGLRKAAKRYFTERRQMVSYEIAWDNFLKSRGL